MKPTESRFFRLWDAAAKLLARDLNRDDPQSAEAEAMMDAFEEWPEILHCEFNDSDDFASKLALELMSEVNGVLDVSFITEESGTVH